MGSFVVFKGGNPAPRLHKSYPIASPKVFLGHSDDYESIREAIRRRFRGYALPPDSAGTSIKGTRRPTSPLPGLLLIDGGKGQLGAALEALNEIGLSAVGSNFGGGGGRGICVSPGGNDQGQAMAVVSLAKRLEEVCEPPPLSLLAMNKLQSCPEHRIC